MKAFTITAHEPYEEDAIVRAMHADDLCAAIWDIQQMLIKDMKHSEDEKKQDLAGDYLKSLNDILDETNAEIAMRTYT